MMFGKKVIIKANVRNFR